MSQVCSYQIEAIAEAALSTTAGRDLLDRHAKEVEQLRDELALLKSERANNLVSLHQFVDWLESNPRRPAHIAFTAGPERQLADRVEAILEEVRRLREEHQRQGEVIAILDNARETAVGECDFELASVLRDICFLLLGKPVARLGERLDELAKRVTKDAAAFSERANLGSAEAIAKLTAENSRLRTEHDAALALVADVRAALGDDGKRMQPEFLEWCRGLAETKGIIEQIQIEKCKHMVCLTDDNERIRCATKGDPSRQNWMLEIAKVRLIEKYVALTAAEPAASEGAG